MIDTEEWRKSMAWLQIDNKIETSARDIYLLLDEIDRLRAEVNAARMEGWYIATGSAIQLNADSWFGSQYDYCEAIKAMQPPAEWSAE